jgi:hypothetical protein
LSEALDFLDHNELELAADVLAEVGARARPRAEFWIALADAVGEIKLAEKATAWRARGQGYPCPCCGHVVFDEPPGSYSICPICFWEDDLVQLRGSTTPAERIARASSRAATFRRVGAMEERFIGNIRPPSSDEPLEVDWRPIDPTIDRFEPRGSQERPWPDDSTVLYWWRASFWRRTAT